MNLHERFNSRWMPEPFSGCWIWTCETGGKMQYGSFQGRVAHRVSWEIHNGVIPKGICVCHHCDTPLCVNPNHLFLGTIADNNRDMAAKGRVKHVGIKGEQSNFAKLTEAEVLSIRAACGTQREIAKQFRTSKSNVHDIRSRRNWRHI